MVDVAERKEMMENEWNDRKTAIVDPSDCTSSPFLSPKNSFHHRAVSSFESPERQKHSGQFKSHKSPITPGSKKKETRASMLLQSRSAAKSRQARLGKTLHAEDLIDTAVAFMKETENIEQAENLKALYSLIRRKTGALGGGGAGGAIYGEVTKESFQKIVECLKAKTGFGSDSVFIDIGAGLGKPNFHVTINPGVKLSLGVEVIGGRWWQSICLLDQCLDDDRLQHFAQKVFFAHADVQDMHSFDPITHVYSFNRGFPPEAMKAVARAFHKSKTAKYFICFDKIKVLEGHGFDITLIDFVPTKMAGSGEQHRCYIYRRNDISDNNLLKKSPAPLRLRALSPLRSPARVFLPPTSPIKSPKEQTSGGKSTAVKDRTPVRTRSRALRMVVEGKSATNKVSQRLSEKRAERVKKRESTPERSISPSSISPQTPSPSKRGPFGWFLVQPPSQVEFAPHVPHAKTYLRGLDAMVSDVDEYQQWVKDQIGLHRCDRVSRSSRRAASQQTLPR